MKKKHIIAAGVILVGAAGIGGTIAYFDSTASFDNDFHLTSGKVEYTENFASPDNWKSCDETPKTMVITNKSDVPVAARFKIEEYWKRKNSTSTDHTSEISLNYQNQPVAIINFQNQNDWEKKGDWYVYKGTLQKNESTSSLLKSVTFNCDINFAGGVTYSADGKSGQTNTTDYQDAKYHLFITAQTVAASEKAEAWGE